MKFGDKDVFQVDEMTMMKIISDNFPGDTVINKFWVAMSILVLISQRLGLRYETVVKVLEKAWKITDGQMEVFDDLKEDTEKINRVLLEAEAKGGHLVGPRGARRIKFSDGTSGPLYEKIEADELFEDDFDMLS